MTKISKLQISLITATAVMTSTAFAEAPKTLNATTSDKKVVVDAFNGKEARVPTFQGLDARFLQAKLTQADYEAYKKTIAALNPKHTEEDLWEQKLWDIHNYDKENLPVIVGMIENKDAFSSKYKDQGLRFLDLPIFMPGQGWRLPPQLEQFKEVIAQAIAYERVRNPDFEKDYYVYITVDQGLVQPHTSQRRAGWHGDSYRKVNSESTDAEIPTDIVYVVADNSPTLFLSGPFSLEGVDPENVDAVLEKFAAHAKGKEPITYPNYTLLKLDPYCVHDVGVNKTDKPIYRTFVKISVSKLKYCKLGNAHNQLFIYDWPMVPRHNVPYTKDAIEQSAHRKDRDRFEEIDPKAINFMKTKCSVDWAKPAILSVYKVGLVKAEPAIEGDLIESKNDDFLITINVARKGDWKVTSSTNDIYFVSDLRFQSAYEKDPVKEGFYRAKKNMRRAVELTKDVRFKGPWGTLQYATKGAMLVYVNEQDIYAVPRELFEKTYRVVG